MSTGIQWTEKTWNPVTGCTRVSAGCDNCYAFDTHDRRRYLPQKRAAERQGYASIEEARGAETEALPPILPFKARQYDVPFSEVQLLPDRLEDPLRWRKPAHVFVDSMGDLFHEDVPDAYLDRVFAVMALAPQHTFQVLTKRPERMREYLSRENRASFRISDEAFRMRVRAEATSWPLPNVWLGTSVEDQAAADERIPHLLQTPAAVRFLSCEPLLGPLRLPECTGYANCPLDSVDGHSDHPFGGIDWVIVGGESGPRARPCDVGWIRDIVEQCQAAGVPYFVKQLGSKPLAIDTELWERDGRSWETMQPTGARVPMKLKHGHGGDPAEWPEDLRVREWPEVTA